ncbi:MAG TPA: hypothetical protein VL327_01050 [Pyrinomonadaceae bacterium]|nr:hypothetical protein [Pyrinomonadaceae bacterium]
MKRIVLGLGLVFALSMTGFAQKSSTKAYGSATNNTSASKNGKNIDIASGTQITGQLQNSLVVQKAKVGDEVVLKTTSTVKQNGQVVIQKGSRLMGHVTEVQKRAQGQAASKVGVLFDTLAQGGNQIPISAVITSVTQERANSSVGDDISSDVSGSSSTTASTRSSGGGGLLGGVGNTVGGVVNSTTQTVGSVTNTVGQTVGNTTQTVGGTLRGIQISQSTDASASGGSTLSLNGGNLRLDKGTTFNLSLSESASVHNN